MPTLGDLMNGICMGSVSVNRELQSHTVPWFNPCH